MFNFAYVECSYPEMVSHSELKKNNSARNPFICLPLLFTALNGALCTIFSFTGEEF